MRSRITRVLGVFGALALASCSGAGSPGAKPAAPVAPQAGTSRSGATISIKIPHATNPQAVARYLSKRPLSRGRDYVSPATQSISIAVTDSSNTTTTTNASLSITAAGSGPNPVECVSGVLSTTCSITLALAPGNYTASFTTYDGPLDGNNAPTGSTLSQNQAVPFTVTSGQSNQLAVSLAAIPASVSIVPASNEKFVRGNQQDGFSLIVTGLTHTFNVEAFDADGDTIIGPGAPTWTSNLQGRFTAAITIAAPTAANPNTFTFLTTSHLDDGFPKDSQRGASTTLTLTAAPPAGAGVSCTTATCSRTAGFDSIDALFEGDGNEAAIFVEGDASALIRENGYKPTSSVTDNRDNVFFSQSNDLYEWSPPYDAPPVRVASEPVTAVSDLTLDPSGALYFDAPDTTDASGKTSCVYQSRPPYSTTTQQLCGFEFAGREPQQTRLLADAHGRMIVSDSNEVLIFGNNGGSAQSFPGSEAGLLIDSAGELLVFDRSAGHILSYTFNTSTARYQATGVMNSNTYAETPARSGAGFFLEPFRTAGQAGQIASYPVPLTAAAPTLYAVPLITQLDDFVLTGTNNPGVAGIDGGSSLIEIFNLQNGPGSNIARTRTNNLVINDIQ